MSTFTVDRAPCRAPIPAGPLRAMLPFRLAARMANLALTARVQVDYAVATAASENAARTADWIEQAWPASPLRSMTVGAFRSQAQERARAARDVLARARRQCGLAYAAI